MGTPRATVSRHIFCITGNQACWLAPAAGAPRPAAIDLSTLLQQTLALIAERGGLHAREAWSLLCGKAGPFSSVPPGLYADLLRRMGDPEVALIEQAPDGTLLLGRAGEKLVDHYEFYAVFATSEEFRVMHGSRTLGTLPVEFPLMIGATIIFGGRRWQVIEVAEREKLISVEPSTAGAPPSFFGGDGDLDDRVVRAMFDLYRSEAVPPFLDQTARVLLAEGRAAFARHRLAETALIADDGGLWLFPWVGTIRLNTLMLALRAAGLDANPSSPPIGAPHANLTILAANFRGSAPSRSPTPLVVP